MTVSTEKSLSSRLYAEACELMPGGVNSPVRAFRAVGGTPIYFEKALGSHITDVDGNKYIDYVSSWGAIILGHANRGINDAISDAAQRGVSFGASHAGELRLAREVIWRMKTIEMVRFVNSGTEASMAVIRLARAATGRQRILKFAGNYHGAVDSLLAKAGSGIATFGLPDSAGVPPDVARGTLVARYNDVDNVRELLEANRGEVAAILVEPVVGNMGVVPPLPGFLEALRTLADEHQALLIFDEVMTGFRVSKGGAAARFGIRPDLTCMGKVIGGGLPVGAYGGRRDLMELVAPLGPVYQAGTLSGNPLAMAAGYEALSSLTDEVYEHLERMGALLESGLEQALSDAGVDGQVQRVASMISVFFSPEVVTDFDSAQKSNTSLYQKLFHGLLERGVYLPPSALEAWFLNASHTEEDINRTIEAFSQALSEAIK